MAANKKRCHWVSDDPIYIAYHDEEWGVPVFDDQTLFEFLILEGQQAGLSWITILKRRDNYRACFDGFDAQKIARYSPSKLNKLLQNPALIRNRLKIEAIIKNAQAYLAIKETRDTFAEYIWQFVNGAPIQNHWKTPKQVPVNTPQSTAMSKDLKKQGFKFVGSTICYAYMQATGMVNDHTTDCFRHQQLM